MKLKEGFIIRYICGEYVLYEDNIDSVDCNQLVTFNKSAAYLWETVQGKEFDIPMLASLLVNKYKIDEGTALQDAAELCNLWKKIKVIVD